MIASLRRKPTDAQRARCTTVVEWVKRTKKDLSWMLHPDKVLHEDRMNAEFAEELIRDRRSELKEAAHDMFRGVNDALEDALQAAQLKEEERRVAAVREMEEMFEEEREEAKRKKHRAEWHERAKERAPPHCPWDECENPGAQWHWEDAAGGSTGPAGPERERAAARSVDLWGFAIPTDEKVDGDPRTIDDTFAWYYQFVRRFGDTGSPLSSFWVHCRLCARQPRCTTWQGGHVPSKEHIRRVREYGRGVDPRPPWVVRYPRFEMLPQSQ